MTSRRERRKVEMLFAHLKRILRLDGLRLRGSSAAPDEFFFAATESPKAGKADPAARPNAGLRLDKLART